MSRDYEHELAIRLQYVVRVPHRLIVVCDVLEHVERYHSVKPLTDCPDQRRIGYVARDGFETFVLAEQRLQKLHRRRVDIGSHKELPVRQVLSEIPETRSSFQDSVADIGHAHGRHPAFSVLCLHGLHRVR